MAFRVGQKVVCVDATTVYPGGTGDPASRWLSEGHIYTIRKIMCRKNALVWLNEIDRTSKTHYDTGFAACRFRPIVERKTDISIFTKMLNPSKQTVDAR